MKRSAPRHALGPSGAIRVILGILHETFGLIKSPHIYLHLKISGRLQVGWGVAVGGAVVALVSGPWGGANGASTTVDTSTLDDP
ncbi:hypothetical protein GDO78_017285 [Eleutherodactylus coqui]|uniref:Uncharacterized protein n=1 Tax=Eleutherodactylus coqui TaxID=57060 RepID=A0A8J6E843_ELECQ|nr:hypothetical protein GDO78_017285 [Eleutherodactylus coqui]